MAPCVRFLPGKGSSVAARYVFRYRLVTFLVADGNFGLCRRYSCEGVRQHSNQSSTYWQEKIYDNCNPAAREKFFTKFLFAGALDYIFKFAAKNFTVLPHASAASCGR